MWNSTEIVIVAFAAVSALRVFAYLPQIVRIFQDSTGAAAISCCTWLLFLVSNLTTVAYAVVVVEDTWMAFVFAANAICSAAILALALFRRQRIRAVPKAAMQPAE